MDLELELTEYMKRDLYFAGVKSFNFDLYVSGVQPVNCDIVESPYQVGTEADRLWKRGWACAQREAEQA